MITLEDAFGSKLTLYVDKFGAPRIIVESAGKAVEFRLGDSAQVDSICNFLEAYKTVVEDSDASGNDTK